MTREILRLKNTVCQFANWINLPLAEKWLDRSTRGALEELVQGIDGGDDRPGRDRDYCHEKQGFDDELKLFSLAK